MEDFMYKHRVDDLEIEVKNLREENLKLKEKIKEMEDNARHTAWEREDNS